MTRYLPTLRGWAALLLAVPACLLYPLLLPTLYVQSGGSGWYSEPVSTVALVAGGVIVVACFVVSLEAWRRGSRTDRAVAVIAILFAIGLLTEVLGARTVPVRPAPNKSVQATAAPRFRFRAFEFSIHSFCRPQSLSAAVPDLWR
jgi:hypothetical protein